MKISIIYYSKTNNTHNTARLIKEGIDSIGHIETKLMLPEEINVDFVNQSDAIIFGSPTYYANMCWQIKKFFDEDCSALKLEGKLGAVFSTANTFGGGSETALLTLVNHILVKGMLVYSGGTALGQPFTHLGLAMIKDGDDFQKERAKVFGERIAKKSMDIFK